MSGSLLPLSDTTPLLGNALPNYAAPPDPNQVTMAQGLGDLYSKVRSYIAQQRAQSVNLGLLDPDSGLPTQAGLVDAARQYAQGLLMGTTAPGAAPASGITAFHGSPHDFEAFDASKIGTGQGAQMFGHGLYFAENPGVAQTYRDELAQPNFDATKSGAPISSDVSRMLKDGWDAAASQGIRGPSPGDAVFMAQQNVQQQLKDAAKAGDFDWYNKAADQAAELARIDKDRPSYSGRMYEVNINADPQHFLDWDKPLSEQSQHVQDAINQHRGMAGFMAENPDATGEALYRYKANPTGGGFPEPAGAAATMQAYGIPGIKYLDQGSRGAGEGTRNYVVFDPSIISIARKYAVPAAVLSGTGAGLVQQGQQSQ